MLRTQQLRLTMRCHIHELPSTTKNRIEFGDLPMSSVIKRASALCLISYIFGVVTSVENAEMPLDNILKAVITDDNHDKGLIVI